MAVADERTVSLRSIGGWRRLADGLQKVSVERLADAPVRVRRGGFSQVLIHQVGEYVLFVMWRSSCTD